MSNGDAVTLQARSHGAASRARRKKSQRPPQRQISAAILEHLPVGVAELRLDGAIAHANRRLATLLGEDSLEGRRCLDFIAPRHRARAGEQLDAVIAGRADKVSRQLLSGRPGRRAIWLRITVSAIADARERPRALLLMAEDITAQKKAQQEARLAQRICENAIESISEAVVIYDAQDRMVLCNSKFREVYPWLTDELCRPGTPFKEFALAGYRAGAYPDAEGRRDAWLAQRLREHRDFARTFLRPLANGSWLQVRNRPLSDGGIVGIRTDVTEIMQVREALARSEATFRGIMQNVADGIVTIDSAGVVTSFNAAAERIFGYAPPEVLGRNVSMLMAEPDRSEHDGHLRRYVESGQRRVVGKGAREVVGLHKDGRRLELELATSEMASNGRRDFIGVLRDISHRKRIQRELTLAKEQAEKASRAKSAFLAHMSHELRTPLNAVIGFSEVLHTELFGALGSPKYREYAGDIHRAGKHLLGVINDILDLAKAEAGKACLHVETLNAAEAAEDALRMVRSKADEQQVALASNHAERPVLLQADGQKLRQILLNLLTNAVKFTLPGGEVRLELRASDGWAEITVADTGVGMSPEDLAKALEPFGQVESELNRRREGTGLGLPLVKRLTELHGGELRIDSARGRGTSVQVRLPQAGPPQPAAAAHPGAVSQGAEREAPNRSVRAA